MTAQPNDRVFDSTDGMSPECKTALRNLLIACADTKLLLGYHYGEWTFGPPEIEAAIACCSLCQTELGHVRLLHAILNTHFKDDPAELVESRQPKEFANVPYLDDEIRDWPDFVAANYLVDLAITSLLFSMKDSSFKPLHMSLEKMLQEERYHIHHGQGWFRTLAKKSAETKTGLAKSAKRALRSVVEWFGPPKAPADRVLVAAGIKADSNEEILSKMMANLSDLCQSLDLEFGLVKSGGDSWELADPIDWQGWNPATRRSSETGPNPQILYHLKGSKNKVFKLN